MQSIVQQGRVSVGPLEMYYEVHGADAGDPVVLLHGGLTTIDSSFAHMLPELARTRRVIAVEQQAHGHTADVARPLTFVQMADDTAAVLRELGITRADYFGYSDGGNVALGLAIRHSSLVRSLAVAGTNYDNDGLYPEILEILGSLDPEQLGELREAYDAVAPEPNDFPKLVQKVSALALGFPGWTEAELRAIEAPVLVVIADGDIVRPEHAVALFRLLKRAKLAVLPNTTHETLIERSEWLLPMLAEFFADPQQK